MIVCFVALGSQQLLRMLRIMLPVCYSFISYFSMLSHKGNNFRKAGCEIKMYVLIFLTKLSETFLILVITKRYVIIYVQ